MVVTAVTTKSIIRKSKRAWQGREGEKKRRGGRVRQGQTDVCMCVCSSKRQREGREERREERERKRR
jgi:hypothetical protein